CIANPVIDFDIDKANEKPSERFSILPDTVRFREQIACAIKEYELFGEVATLRENPEKTVSDEDLVNKASQEKFDILIVPRIKKHQNFYDGVTGWYIPNMINWFFLWVPSWWVKDEIYGAEVVVELTIYSTHSYRRLLSKEFKGKATAALNDFQRGWNLFGTFTIPGSLSASNWRKVDRSITPLAMRQIEISIVKELAGSWHEYFTSEEFESQMRKWLSITVGISRYFSYNIPKLKYSEEDAISIDKIITTGSNNLLNDRTKKMLINEKATKENIESAIDFLNEHATERDFVIFYFSGYGASIPAKENDNSANNAFYLVPYDAEPEKINSTCISLDRLLKYLSKINAAETIIIIDAAFSADMDARSLTKNSIKEYPFTNLPKKEGVVLLLPCYYPNEGAREIDDHRHGVFTFYFLEGLNGAADKDKDKNISIKEAFDFLCGRVSEETQMEGTPQQPRMLGNPNSKQESSCNFSITRP
ncbi:MAG: caspase family protein, partial [Planctomycetota bacterium]